MYHYFLLEIIALFDSQLRRARWIRFLTVGDTSYPLLANSAPNFLQIFTKRLQKAKNIYVFCAFPKKKAAQNTTGLDIQKAAEC